MQALFLIGTVWFLVAIATGEPKAAAGLAVPIVLPMDGVLGIVLRVIVSRDFDGPGDGHC
jgi:hypothetical protein